MASTSVIEDQTHPEITFYVWGERLPSGTSRGKSVESIFTVVQERFPALLPTTYEASKAYLDRELLKPKGQRNLPREMCMLNVTDVPGDQDIVFIAEATKLLIVRKLGGVLFYPTIDLPPASLGTRENPYSNMLLDRKTDRPGKTTILLAYFTKIGDQRESSGEIETVQLGFSPFK